MALAAGPQLFTAEKADDLQELIITYLQAIDREVKKGKRSASKIKIGGTLGAFLENVAVVELPLSGCFRRTLHLDKKLQGFANVIQLVGKRGKTTLRKINFTDNSLDYDPLAQFIKNLNGAVPEIDLRGNNITDEQAAALQAELKAAYVRNHPPVAIAPAPEEPLNAAPAVLLSGAPHSASLNPASASASNIPPALEVKSRLT
jgi:hypothetical protein